MNHKRLKYFSILGISLICIALVVKAEADCTSCSTILTADQNNQLQSCVQTCEQQYLVQNVFSNYKRSQYFNCTENCQNTEAIKSKRVCEIENCQATNSTAAIPIQKCQFNQCNQFFIDFQLYVGQQSEILVPSKCKDISYTTIDELKTINAECANAFYTEAATALNLSSNTLFKKYQDCLNNNCSTSR